VSIPSGKRVLEIEARAITGLIGRLDRQFDRAVELLYGCAGKVVVSGMGKSGIIAQKIAATLASTGTPAFYLDPAAGLHGDLGMVSRRDVLVALSNSGETEEIVKLLPFMKRLNIPVVAITGKIHSTLAKHSDAVLDVSVAEEACPLGLAPTASTTAALAMGDALAIALLEQRGSRKRTLRWSIRLARWGGGCCSRCAISCIRGRRFHWCRPMRRRGMRLWK
jgi:arabinose-5-phosphate isomerase